MTNRLVDFLSSVGIMLFGVGMLFVCSVTLTGRPVLAFVSHLPVAEVKPFSPGGDIQLAELPRARPAVPLAKDDAVYSGKLTASSAVVVDDFTNTILFKKNPGEVRPLASITKIMSAMVLSEMPIDWSTTTIVQDSDLDPYNHQISAGEQYTLDDLWKIALVGSSNDAVRTLSRNTGLTPSSFVMKMNQKAAALGLNSLHFVEPTGLDSGNVGNAVDILRMFKSALKNDNIASALQTPEYYAAPLNKKIKRHIWSTDWLLIGWIPNNFDKDVLVGKTGYIDQSGYNFVVRIPGPKDHVVRIAILGAATGEDRFTEARDLANWVFEHYLWPGDEGYASSTSNTSKN